jgi:6-phosphogluconolactonase
MPGIEILPDADALACRAVEEFINLAREAIRDHGRFTVALAGGSTPGKMYRLLKEATVDWSGIHIFWGDERCVPPGHNESNYRQAADAFLNQIPIPAGNVHRIHGELISEEAAHYYEIELRHFFGDEIPRFDLILLGLGSDGHTASLFPGEPALLESTHWAVAVHHASPPPPLVDRVTLTLPVINAAANGVFLVSGADKADILVEVLQNHPRPDLLPAQAVDLVNGCLHWMVDQSAAKGLLREGGAVDGDLPGGFGKKERNRKRSYP